MPLQYAKTLHDTRQNGRERPWSEMKFRSRVLSHSYTRIAMRDNPNHYQDDPLYKAAGRVYNCGDNLQFSQVRNEEYGTRKKLSAAFFCRDRLCPMCQWRKSLVTFQQISRAMNYIEENEKKFGVVRPLFLTLTVKNCEAEKLSDTLDQMSSAWEKFLRKLNHHKDIKGIYRAFEITINEETDEYHPHIHALLLVTPEYFRDGYLKTVDFVAMWRKALGIDYDPIVYIEKLDNKNPKSFAEVAKYTVKPGEWLSDDKDKTDHHIETLRNALRGRRLISFTGILKQARHELKMQDIEKVDLVSIEDDEMIRGDVVEMVETYRWLAEIHDYVLVDDSGQNPFI